MRAAKSDKLSVCELFKEWLHKNGHSFNRKLKLRHYRKRGLVRFWFDGVAAEIFGFVDEIYQCDVCVVYKRKFWDFIADFDYDIKRSRDGKYYCSICGGDEFYSSAQELLVKNSFEPLLEWANANLTPSHILLLLDVNRGGLTEASIVDPGRLDMKKPRDKESKKMLDSLSKSSKEPDGTLIGLDFWVNARAAKIPVIK